MGVDNTPYHELNSLGTKHVQHNIGLSISSRICLMLTHLITPYSFLPKFPSMRS